MNNAPTDPISWRRTYTIIFYAFPMSLLCYWFVLSFALKDVQMDSTSMLMLPFAMVSVLLGVTGMFFRSRIFSDADSQATFSELAGKYGTGLIVVCAFFEAIAILGFVLAILGGGMGAYLGFALPSLVLLLTQFPLVGRMTEELERASRR